MSGLESEDEKGSKGMKIEKFGKRIIVGALVAVVGLAGGDRCRVSLVEQSAEYCGLARRRIERAVAAAGQGRLGIEDRRPETGD